MAPLVLGYIKGTNNLCSGDYITKKQSLADAQVTCTSNTECSCIEDDGCDGGDWFLYTGAPITSSLGCAWINKGNVIGKLDKNS